MGGCRNLGSLQKLLHKWSFRERVPGSMPEHDCPTCQCPLSIIDISPTSVCVMINCDTFTQKTLNNFVRSSSKTLAKTHTHYEIARPCRTLSAGARNPCDGEASLDRSPTFCITVGRPTILARCPRLRTPRSKLLVWLTKHWRCREAAAAVVRRSQRQLVLVVADVA